ncbi:hypothetical protein [Bacillus sp. MRMR6]|uniref:hypothetical protein n=1 Tax=Bacillus sp. MRMR6 TaxID=1928617 RepID=UPI0009513EF5|nr:hypothetical protein [Bacillus sp. MRMR6]OLS34467.1 hypothetical protein BTR25_21830 [Bacillus sp. MRMR6]
MKIPLIGLDKLLFLLMSVKIVETSTVTAIFVDESGLTPNRSFTFTSTAIAFVGCFDFGQGFCELVIIGGMGLVVGETIPREFMLSLSINNQIGNFPIFDFTRFVEGGNLEPDLTFFGCPAT